MKKILAFLVSLMMLFSTCIAEEVLNRDNSEELAAILDSEAPYPSDVEKFANDNLGKTIEFSACIVSVDYTSYNEVDLYAGDWESFSTDKAHFMIEGVTIDDLRDVITEYQEITGEALSDDDAWMYLSGLNAEVCGIIRGYTDYRGTIELEPVSIHLKGYDAAEESSAVEAPKEEAELDTSGYATLEKGSKGDDVKALQQKLIDLHYLDDVADGSYGEKTKAAVEKFQSAAKLSVTGIADPTTQAVLFSPDAPEASLSISCSSVVVGSMAQTTWFVDGQQFTLSGNQTKTLKTMWGTYTFDSAGNYEKID